MATTRRPFFRVGAQMIAGGDAAQRLVDHPTEGLTVGLKRRLDWHKSRRGSEIVMGRGSRMSAERMRMLESDHSDTAQ